MLKREEAQAALKAFQVADWEARRLSELEQLPPLLGAWGKALLQLEGSRYEDVGKAVRAMDSWAVEVRSQLLDVAFGPISSWVAKTYDLLLELPYQQGCARRSFRSSNSRHYAARRHSWLMSMLTITRGYEQPVEWYAAWAPFLGYRADALGLMFAAAINEGGKVGDQVFEIICDSARGEHDIGSMGRHVTRALLVANRPEGWQLIENMLVAAQRQEGLRQVILETIDEAHPEAFARMLRVIVEQNMVRFSATIRAADVWFGLNWTVDQKRWVKETLEKTLDLFELDLLEKDKQIESLLQSDVPTRVYLALWRMAFDDAMVAVEAATRLLKDERAERRFVAVYLLRQMNDIPEATSVLLTCLSDSHLRVAVEAFLGMQYSGLRADESELFEQLETYIERFSEKEMTLEPLVWPWMQAKIARSQIADALTRALGFRPIERLLPYLSTMTPWVRAKQAERLIKITPWDESIRSAVFDLLGDRSSVVRESAISALKRHYIPTPAGAPQLEALLPRKAADLRRGILALLLKLSDAEAVNSAERLLAAPKAPQRLAGLELLEQLQRTERADGREIALQYQQQRKEKREKRSASEQELLDKLLANTQVVPTLDDALGLAPPAQRSPSPLPQPPQSPIPLTSPAAERLLLSLDELIEAHKTTPVTLQYVHREHTEELLGNVRWLPLYRLKKSREENIEQFPLVQVWLNWWQNRPASLRDEDGLEGIRAIAAFTQSSNSFNASFYNPFRIAAPPDWDLRYKQAWFTNKEQIQSEHVSSILQWLLQV
ncbi:MAG: HEAT repeat domain-containing protein [Phormidesmis sp.]